MQDKTKHKTNLMSKNIFLNIKKLILDLVGLQTYSTKVSKTNKKSNKITTYLNLLDSQKVPSDRENCYNK